VSRGRREVGAGLAACLAATLALAGCGRAAGSGSDRLRLSAPSWWFSRLPLAVEATPAGALAGREATLTVAVDANVIGRREMKKEPLTLRVPGRHLTPGVRAIAVKTGSERSVVSVRVVSVGWLATPLALGAALGAARLARRRRSAGASTLASSPAQGDPARETESEP
jgi:hypothetical protein